uniref:Uncharacterized protein n=1 Tax=Anopheles coluzzii TaxID=1518534 RepID=A0A8W7P0I3_ANOCL
MDPCRAAAAAGRNAFSPDEAGASAWVDVTPIRRSSSKAESCLACGAAGVAEAAAQRLSFVAESVCSAAHVVANDGTAARGLGVCGGVGPMFRGIPKAPEAVPSRRCNDAAEARRNAMAAAGMRQHTIGHQNLIHMLNNKSQKDCLE